MEIKLDKNHCIHLHKEEEHKKAIVYKKVNIDPLNTLLTLVK